MPISLGLGDAVEGLDLRLNDADQIVGDLRQFHVAAVERHVHQRGGVAGGGVDDRVLRRLRQHVELARDLGLNLRDRRVGVVVQAHVGLDHRHALAAGGGQIVDAVRLCDRLLQRRGDEALDQFAAGARIGRGDGDHGVLGLGVLAHLHLAEGAQTEHEDQQADDAGEDRPVDEDVGELHFGWPCSVLALLNQIQRLSPSQNRVGAPRRARRVVDDDHLDAVAQLHLAGGDHALALAESVEHLHLIAAHVAGVDLAALDHQLRFRAGLGLCRLRPDRRFRADHRFLQGPAPQ